MELHRDRPGDFEVLRENVASIDQHVIALFDIALIEYSGCEAESRAAARGCRIVWIIGVLIRRLVGGCFEFQCAIAAQTVRTTAATQVHLRVTSARERPFALVAPSIVPYHENSDWRFVKNFVFSAFEPMTQESLLVGEQFDLRFRAEVDIAGAARSGHRVGQQMRPWSHDQPLSAAGLVAA